MSGAETSARRPRRGGGVRSTIHVDVAVAGAGPVGATLALALGRAGARVALIEAGAPRPGAGGALPGRPIALGLASRRILERLGPWSALAARESPIERIHVSERGGPAFVRLRATDLGLAALGHVTTSGVLGEALEASLAGAPAGVRLLRPATVTALGGVADAAHLDLAGDAPDLPERVRARLVVLAEGGRSGLRERAGIGVRVRDHGRHALAARVRPARGHANVAYERFTPAGPLALLPLPGGRCGLVWSLPPERAEALAGAPPPEFLAALGEAFGERLGRFVAVEGRAVHPLRTVRASRLVGERLVLVGNAAQTLHPVAGQGLNLGLRDAAVLAEVVADALRAGGDPGAPALLRAYEARRAPDRRLTLAATELLARLFTPRALAPARAAGLLVLDLAPGCRRSFVRRATGYGAPVPRLARGLDP